MGCRVSRERRRSRGLGVDQFARRRQLVGAWTEKCIVNNTNVDGHSAECIAISSVAGATRLGSVVEVRGQGGSAPCNSMSPLIESIVLFYAQVTQNLLGREWIWGLIQPGFVR